MAGGVASIFLGPIVEQLIKPIGKQFGYVIFYKSNIDNMQIQVEKLVNMRDGVLLLTETATRNLETISPNVEVWMINVNDIKIKTDSILQDMMNVTNGMCLHGWCPNIKSRYSLSKKAKKKTRVILDLQVEGNSYVSLSYPAPSTGIEYLLNTGNEKEFESRKSIEEEIMDSMSDPSCKIIGLCGMGGVGKTTIAKKISKRVKEENLFDEVVMIILSQKPDLKEVQGEIAAVLDLTLGESSSLSVRAARLRTRLTNAKRVLIILDNIWERLELDDLGIPCEGTHERCKVVLTSRHHDVCMAMEAQKVITVKVLHEEEAWVLFVEKAGESVNATHLNQIARDVASECKGLPLAIVTVGRALKGKSKPVWEDALIQLKRSIAINIPGVLKDVYRSLQLSYTSLESVEAKSLFLLCCLFPESLYISLEDLVRYGMGLRIFGCIESLAEAKNRVYNLTEMLKDRCLLLDSTCCKEEVKMHDVVLMWQYGLHPRTRIYSW